MKRLMIIFMFLAGNLIAQDIPDTTTVEMGGIIIDAVEIPIVESFDFTLETIGSIESDNLMYNYASGRIEVINLYSFDESDAAIYLIQTPTVLKAYKWMRKNRKQYNILKCVELVNAWWKAKP